MACRYSHRLVQSLSDALAVRRLRNECCTSFTQMRRPIALPRQIVWYYLQYQSACARGSYRVYLFRDDLARAVGYAALSARGDGLYVTECVASERRGAGVGAFILSCMLEIAVREGRVVMAEIWASNEASIRLHERAGFRCSGSSLRDDAELRTYHYGQPSGQAMLVR